jgi:hypothetical protein
MVLPVQVERPHGGGIPCAVTGAGGGGAGGGEAKGPGGLGRAEGAPGPAAHRGDWTRRRCGGGCCSLVGPRNQGLGGAERTAATWPELGRGKGEISSLFPREGNRARRSVGGSGGWCWRLVCCVGLLASWVE